MEVIAHHDNKAYAQRTELGWRIIGKVDENPSDEDSNKKNISITHRVVVCEVWDLVRYQNLASTEGTSKKTCNFCQVDSFQVRQMFERDFSERN